MGLKKNENFRDCSVLDLNIGAIGLSTGLANAGGFLQ